MVKAELNLVGRLLPKVERRALVTQRTAAAQLKFEAKVMVNEALDRAMARLSRWAVLGNTGDLHLPLTEGLRIPTLETAAPKKMTALMMSSPDTSSSGEAGSGSAAPEAPAASHKSGRFVRGLKAMTVGTINGKVSTLKTMEKCAGLFLSLFAAAALPVSGPAALLALIPVGPLYVLGKSKGAKPAEKAEATGKFPFFHVEQKIPAKLRTIIYGLYGVELFGLGVSMAAKGLSLKIGFFVLGLITLGAHLLPRSTAKKVLARQEAETEAMAEKSLQREQENARLAAEAAKKAAADAEARKQPAQKLLEAALAKDWKGFLTLAKSLEQGSTPMPSGKELLALPLALDFARVQLGDAPIKEGTAEGDAQAAIMPLLMKIDPLLPKVD